MTSYTEDEMRSIMQELHIAPENGRVDGSEGAKILTWRAKHEFGVDHQYDPTTLRQHIKTGQIKKEEVNKANPRRNLYPYPLIFQLPIAPRRGTARRKLRQS
jgi:hypothetical protein